ncbi:MAG: 23S rRNA (pseudouridine(1915)-N(3))-methyltransferase RlmH [Eubacterium sp.]|nr:23S rRNA (pseudouridine(1915)-N(3))-methyltransferase RlmH [Eubacterium sp.]
MIKLTVIAVGRLKEKYLRDACEEYKKRLSAYAKVNIIEIDEYRCSESPSPAEIEQVKNREGEAIAAKIPKGAYIIPMCIEGTQLSSEEIAAKLSDVTVKGYGEIALIIGGSFGISDAVKAQGNFKLSFGKITLPHQLMRVVTLEQLYRATSILNNSKYHK